MYKPLHFMAGFILGVLIMAYIQRPYYEKSVINDAVWMAVNAVIEQRQELGLCN